MKVIKKFKENDKIPENAEFLYAETVEEKNPKYHPENYEQRYVNVKYFYYSVPEKPLDKNLKLDLKK